MASPNVTFTELVSTTFRKHMKQIKDNVTSADDAIGTECFSNTSVNCEVLAFLMSAFKQSSCRASMNCLRVNEG